MTLTCVQCHKHVRGAGTPSLTTITVPPPGRRRRRQLSAVSLDDAFGGWQTKAAAAMFRREERLEHLLAHLGAESEPSVRDPDLGRLGSLPHGHLDLPLPPIAWAVLSKRWRKTILSCVLSTRMVGSSPVICTSTSTRLGSHRSMAMVLVNSDRMLADANAGAVGRENSSRSCTIAFNESMRSWMSPRMARSLPSGGMRDPRT